MTISNSYIRSKFTTYSRGFCWLDWRLLGQARGFWWIARRLLGQSRTGRSHPSTPAMTHVAVASRGQYCSVCPPVVTSRARGVSGLAKGRFWDRWGKKKWHGWLFFRFFLCSNLLWWSDLTNVGQSILCPCIYSFRCKIHDHVIYVKLNVYTQVPRTRTWKHPASLHFWRQHGTNQQGILCAKAGSRWNHGKPRTTDQWKWHLGRDIGDDRRCMRDPRIFKNWDKITDDHSV